MLFGIPVWVYCAVITVLLAGMIVLSRRAALKRQDDAFESIHSRLAVGQHVVVGGFLHGQLRELQKYTAKIEVADNIVLTVEKFAITRIME